MTIHISREWLLLSDREGDALLGWFQGCRAAPTADSPLFLNVHFARAALEEEATAPPSLTLPSGGAFWQASCDVEMVVPVQLFNGETQFQSFGQKRKLAEFLENCLEESGESVAKKLNRARGKSHLFERSHLDRAMILASN